MLIMRQRKCYCVLQAEVMCDDIQQIIYKLVCPWIVLLLYPYCQKWLVLLVETRMCFNNRVYAVKLPLQHKLHLPHTHCALKEETLLDCWIRNRCISMKWKDLTHSVFHSGLVWVPPIKVQVRSLIGSLRVLTSLQNTAVREMYV